MAYTVASTASMSTYGWDSTPTLSPHYYSLSQQPSPQPSPQPQHHQQPHLHLQLQQDQTDQETISTFWRFLASSSSYLVLAGFLVLPLAFTSSNNNPNNENTTTPSTDPTTTIIAASVLIAIGYTITLMLIFFQRHERQYLLHSIYIPNTTTSLLSLLNILLNILCRHPTQSPGPLAPVQTTSLVLPSVFAFLYALGALSIYAGDMCIFTTTTNSGVDRGRQRHNKKKGKNNQLLPLTEEEMQRQQLQRLLDQNSSPRRGPSPRVVQKTFRVSAPERINPGKGWDTFTPDLRVDGSGNGSEHGGGGGGGSGRWV
ncbi:uncharacterized protein BO87DRAFT_454381 [Aspergillus neoniger CBS 115656]|uniref:Uncharacterized protein n=1 Tax=Aspergillus neoniger (strain CBS 115656) TaxID=1448310 RepID=A0A318YXY8_ASPNB|nr:hypothetical protein BO87DRAFT_454381 [Aspergillus neoniger CBS 115656]PYH39526.1 hypothetical protein BO87DRAFT_454381 [Aspergillus neoniger CBS 115656]